MYKLIWYILSFFAIFFLNLSVAKSQEKYNPIYGNPLNEPWRWTYFDELTGKGIRCIAETADGNIVFGTNKGIIIYDGQNWREYDSTNGFINNTVYQLVFSEEKLLYAGTKAGLYEFNGQQWRKISPKGNTKYDRFIQKIICLKKLKGGGIIAAVGVDNYKGLLIYKNGLFDLFASNTTIDSLGTVKGMRMHRVPEDKCIDSIFHVEDVFQDNQGRFWIWGSNYTETGHVFYFTWDKENNEIKYSPSFSSSDKIVIGRGAKFEQDEKGNIWMINSTFYRGLSVFNGKSWSYTKLKGENSFVSIANIEGNIWIGGFGVLYAYIDEKWEVYERPLTPIPTSKIFVFKDSYGYLWIAGIEGDVIRIDYTSNRWNSLKFLNFHCDDPDNNLWFISVDGRIVVKRTDNWYSYNYKDGLPDAPVKVFCTKDGLICVAGSYKEQACISFFDGLKWNRQIFPELSWGIDYRVVYEDNDRNLWVGSSFNFFTDKGQKGGIIKIQNPGEINQENTHYLPKNGTTMPTASGLAQSENGSIWLGGAHLARYMNNIWEEYKEIDELNHHISCMGNTPEGTIWIGSRMFGVFRYKNNSWDFYNIDNGLMNNTIIDILPVKEDDIWIATNSDFCRFDGKSWTTELFHNGLTLSREEGDIQIQKEGTLWINRSSRSWNRRAIHNNIVEKDDYDYYSTLSFKADTFKPDTKITQYFEEVPSVGNTYIEWTGADSWNETMPSKLQFSYRLNNGEWSNFKKKNNVTFLNLKNGEYTFEVRARDIDFNIDTSPARVHFFVLPPVWKQAWFIILIVFLLAIIIVYQIIARNQNKNLENLNKELVNHGKEIERKNIMLEEQKEQILQQNIYEKEINHSKLRFFTNISHEFRTPLTLVTGIIDNLSEESFADNPKYFKEQLTIIKKNAKQLLLLINQLMDFRKLDNNVISLSISEIEIISIIKDICNSFNEFARMYQITISFNSQIEKLNGWIDIDKVEKILYNLISNAIKFTQGKGKITIKLNKVKLNNSNYIEIVIEDTGKGIPENEIEKIFECFYQVDGSNEKKLEGTGIGLSLVNNYVNLLHGKMKITSTTKHALQLRRGYSTHFTVTLPIDRSAYKEYEIKKTVHRYESSSKESIFLETDNNELNVNDIGDIPELPEKSPHPHILIVEDNDDLRSFMVNSLKKQYKVSEAKNGSEGYDLSISLVPDIIISDIMMPELSGSELCTQIKSDLRTSHIPVILLTALTNDENIIEGYQTGADDYITKPFSFSVLTARINNILSIRAKLKRKFINEEAVNPDEVKVLSMDTELLKKSKSILEDNYTNPQFSVEDLSKKIGISSRHLQNKLKSLIGQTPNEYIKIFRLKKAANLLAGKKASISEIAYEIGFNDLSYFGKCFTKYYGLGPTEYIKMHYNKLKDSN